MLYCLGHRKQLRYNLRKSVYTSVDHRRERKHSLKLGKLLETQEHAQAQYAEERRLLVQSSLVIQPISEV